MKTAIIYYSKHHKNTKKILDGIKAKHNDIDLFDITNNTISNLKDYDRIGFASGIYYSKFEKTLLQYAKDNLPDKKEVFFIYTFGAKKENYTKAIKEIAINHNSTNLKEFGCYGFNTYGPFKLIGGINKKHPDDKDIENAISFYEEL